jgi:uncharacterized protein YkuJ
LGSRQTPIIGRGECSLNQLEVKAILINLQNKQYIDSDITHTFSENSNALFSVKYSKRNKTFNVIRLETNYEEKFDDVDSAVDCITRLISK